MSVPCGWCLTGDHVNCRGWYLSVDVRCGCRETATCGGPSVRPVVPVVQEKARQARPRPHPACRCCGEPTKGGKFLPGHDSKYLSQLLADSDLERAAELAGQVSPAFRRKFDTRAGADRG